MATLWKEDYKLVTTTRTTGASALSYNLSYTDGDYELLGFELHLNSAGAVAENFSVDLDSGAGSVYDVNLYKVSMSGVSDIVYTYDNCFYGPDDVIKFTWANAGGKTYGLTVRYRRTK